MNQLMEKPLSDLLVIYDCAQSIDTGQSPAYCKHTETQIETTKSISLERFRMADLLAYPSCRRNRPMIAIERSLHHIPLS